tara:strand:- start:1321 stop:1620 length:300 start_codon:yes stop_codon:yes gene_type:complete
MIDKNQYLEATTIQLEMWDQWFTTLENDLGSARTKIRESLEAQLTQARRLKRRVEARLKRADRKIGQGWVEARGELEAASKSFRAAAIELFDKSRLVVV